ncbi:hypothetical protein Ancab_010810 [Ancistrocladus abbreviatus]
MEANDWKDGSNKDREGANIGGSINKMSYFDIVCGRVVVKMTKPYPFGVPSQMQQSRRKNGVMVNFPSMELNVSKEDMEWVKGCYVGCVNEVESISILQERIRMEGCSVIYTVHPMGGNMVLLSSNDKVELKDLIELGKV